MSVIMKLFKSKPKDYYSFDQINNRCQQLIGIDPPNDPNFQQVEIFRISKFRFTRRDVKKQLENLIQAGYVKRSEEDSDHFCYVP